VQTIYIIMVGVICSSNSFQNRKRLIAMKGWILNKDIRKKKGELPIDFREMKDRNI